MTTKTRIEIKLPNGATVLGKIRKGEPWPMGYCNRTQAETAARGTGGFVVQWGRVFFVKFENPAK